MNKANEYRPKTFSEVLGHKNHVRFLTNLIKLNKHKEVKCILLAGSPGSGKSTLAALYARATLCTNRAEGTYEPCGECSVCTSRDNSNIMQYVITDNSAETKSDLRRLIELSYQQPITRSNRSDQYRRFFIIDETQLMSADNLALLLNPIEHSPSTTTWILISMDLEKLEKKEPILCDAIVSRSVVLRMASLTKEDIAKGLLNQYELDYNAALLIGKIANGNMRDAWNILTHLLVLEGDISKINEEIVYGLYLGGANKSSRARMWEAYSNGDRAKVMTILDSWLSLTTDSKHIAHLLVKDIMQAMVRTDGLGMPELLGSLGRWYNSHHTYPLASVLLSHIDTGIKVEIEVEDMDSVKDEIKKQLIRTLARKSGVPALLSSNNFSSYYDTYKNKAEAAN